MAILFHVLRASFFFLTLVMGIFLVRGDILFGEQLFLSLKLIFMPGYLLFCGIMIGYLIALIWSARDTSATSDVIKEKILKKSFIIGIVVGLILAMSYIFI